MAMNTQEVVIFIILFAIALPVAGWLLRGNFEQRYGYKKRKRY
jgi:hypothetical protein